MNAAPNQFEGSSPDAPVGGAGGVRLNLFEQAATILLASLPASLRRGVLRRLAVRGERAERVATFPRQRDLCLRVAAMAGSPPVLAGETSIAELVALVARARMVIGNDSGAAHIASAVGTPVVSIFGSTVPELGYAAHGPHTRVVEHPSLECRPCGRHGAQRCPLGHFRCMGDLRAEWVIGRMRELLEATLPPLELPAMTTPDPTPRVVPRLRARADQPRPGLAPG